MLLLVPRRRPADSLAAAAAELGPEGAAAYQAWGQTSGPAGWRALLAAQAVDRAVALHRLALASAAEGEVGDAARAAATAAGHAVAVDRLTGTAAPDVDERDALDELAVRRAVRG